MGLGFFCWAWTSDLVEAGHMSVAMVAIGKKSCGGLLDRASAFILLVPFFVLNGKIKLLQK